MIDFKVLGGFVTDRRTDRQTDRRTDIGGCRVGFATEKFKFRGLLRLSRPQSKKKFGLQGLHLGQLDGSLPQSMISSGADTAKSCSSDIF